MLYALLLTAVLATPDDVEADEPVVEVDETGKPIGELPPSRSAPTISCCMSREIVGRPIVEALPKIKACWNALPRRQRDQRITRRVQFWVAKGENRMDEVVVKGPAHPVDACLIEVYEGVEWEFVAPCRFGALYPYKFEPAGRE